MKKSLLLTLALGLFTSLSQAAPKKTEEAKPTATETKKAAKEEAKPAAKTEAKKTTPRSKQKPEELSDADKALLAGAKKKVDALTATQKEKLLDYANKGDAKALTSVDGVGEVISKNIIAERPFNGGEELILVDRLGEGTFDNILASVTGAKAKAEPKKEEKKAEPKTEPKSEKKAEPKTEKKEAPKTEKKKAA